MRGYTSRVDGSVQPYGLTIPGSYDGSRPMRLDVWLHGTQLQLNEVRFITQQEAPHETSQIAADITFSSTAGTHEPVVPLCR